MAGSDLGKRIRLRRQALHLTQQQLAEKVGVDRASVSSWERGIHHPGRNEGAIEAALGISLSGEEDQEEVYTDPAERSIWENPLFPSAELRRHLIGELRAARQDHNPRAKRPPA